MKAAFDFGRPCYIAVSSSGNILNMSTQVPRGTPDTIAAIATPAGHGGIGIVRVSGALVGAVMAGVLGKAPEPRHAHYAAFKDRDDDTIDLGVALYFPAPHSYTGKMSRSSKDMADPPSWRAC